VARGIKRKNTKLLENNSNNKEVINEVTAAINVEERKVEEPLAEDFS